MKYVLVATVLASLPAAAFSATTSFTDRVSFVAASGATSVQDFESQTVGTDLRAAPIDLGDFSMAVVSVFGLDFNIISNSSLNAPNATIFAHMGLGDGETFTLTFDSAIKAFGADFGGLNDDLQRSQFEVFGETILAPVQVGQVQGFFGFVSDVAFTSLIIRGRAETEGAGIDNITYHVAPVPLPASLPLLLAGIGLLGLSRRRKA